MTRRPGRSGRKEPRPILSEEDLALFQGAIAGTVPLGARDRIAAPPPPPSPAPRAPELPPEVKLAVEGDGSRYAARAPGVSHAQTAELRAGKIHIEETLDLHGEQIAPARDKLRAFLAGAARVRRCVLVIHGKGTHSDHGAPLREAVVGELLGPLSGLVHAFTTAAPAHGGEGATCILLRRSAR
ncbi:MAG: Smr/MutS family protein [Deltaproteobacteria bacterium]|nr:Smr/MutS family protein [Deltaproteobacteria bacterium]MCW5805136.1 Smr/MutS family protein [Deltaproteobacteria bacterium]